MSDFNTLIEPGQIANYQSCRISLVYVHEKSTKTNVLLFCRLSMSDGTLSMERPVVERKDITNAWGLGTVQQDIDLATAKKIFNGLKDKNIWVDPNNHSLSIDKELKLLNAKFCGIDQHYRERQFLSNSSNGNHYIEFFNEHKITVKLFHTPYTEGMLDKIAPIVLEKLQIDLSKISDRIGNIIFDFPVTLMNVTLESTTRLEHLNIHAAWNNRNNIELIIHIKSIEENSIIDYLIARTQSNQSFTIPIKKFDLSMKMYISRADNNILLAELNCGCGTITGLYGTIKNDIPTLRTFDIQGEKHSVDLHFRNQAYNKLHYIEHIKTAIERNEISPSYRQFDMGEKEEAIHYLRTLVRETRSREILMIDPYLTAEDVINILFFSLEYDRQLRCIGSTTVDIHDQQAPNSSPTNQTKSQSKIITQKAAFNNLQSNWCGLDLEMRYRTEGFGSPFHDRFLLFPGVAEENIKPMAYSIGTSFNAVGQQYHVIAALASPQSIIDKFEKIWNSLGDPVCLVYKYPST